MPVTDPDEWEPISRAGLESRLNAEIATLPPGLLNTYRTHATTIAGLPCFRSEQYGTEHVFVVARSGRRLLIFDDVEDEFAIGAVDEDGVMRDWGLYGDLIDALRAL
jgi:hypothetical protein